MEPAEQAKETKDREVPFSAWIPFIAGATCGVAIRLLFSGKPGGLYAAMTGAFIYLAPILVGMVTVYAAERRQRRSWRYYFSAGAVTNLLFVVGTMLVLIEGIICAVIIAPLFMLLGGVGGLVMGAVCRLTKWPKQTLCSVAMLPFLMAPIERSFPLAQQLDQVERAILINAPPAQVWKQIIDAQDIRPAEVERAWLYRIGVPLPIAGTTLQTPDGPVRRVMMGKGIYFDEVFTQWQENRFVRWTYRFRADSFPRHALDEHVAIGGHYFDVRDTSYTLEPADDSMQLTVRMTYRVSTRFNWYARPVARFLMGNLAESNLEYYRNRSESLKEGDQGFSAR